MPCLNLPPCFPVIGSFPISEFVVVVDTQLRVYCILLSLDELQSISNSFVFVVLGAEI